MKNKPKKQSYLKEKFTSLFSIFSGSLSFLGGWQICHNLCLAIITALSLIGITMVGMPLLFLIQYAVYFWSIAVLLLIPTLIIYWRNRKCMSKNILLVNMGIIIAGVPFSYLQNFQVLLWSIGSLLIGIAIFDYSRNRIYGKR